MRSPWARPSAGRRSRAAWSRRAASTSSGSSATFAALNSSATVALRASLSGLASSFVTASTASFFPPKLAHEQPFQCAIGVFDGFRRRNLASRSRKTAEQRRHNLINHSHPSVNAVRRRCRVTAAVLALCADAVRRAWRRRLSRLVRNSLARLKCNPIRTAQGPG